MEAATAVKIQMVYENDFTLLKPLTPIAKHNRRPTIRGPVPAMFPFRIITIETMNNSNEQPKSILWMVIFFIESL